MPGWKHWGRKIKRVISERDLLRHLEEGGGEVWDRPEPPAIDIAAITGAPQPAARRRRRLPSLLPSPALLGAGALACTLLGIGLGAVIFGPGATDQNAPVPQQQQRTPAVQVAMEPADPAFAGARATVSLFFGADGTTAEMSATGLPQPEAGTHYEVWAVNPAGKAVSLGQLALGSGAEAHAQMDVPEELRTFRRLLVSLESEASPSEPSSQPVLQSFTS